MSKKRHSSLSSKWKLSKEYNDYKNHKINKRVGGSGYAEEPKVIRGKKRGKYPCKRNKGDHKWVFQAEHKLKVLNEVYNFYKCKYCGKEHCQQKSKFVCEDCGSEESFFFTLFRHGDRRKCRKCGSYKFKEVLNKIIGER